MSDITGFCRTMDVLGPDFAKAHRKGNDMKTPAMIRADAKDSTDCLASGRVEIVFDNPKAFNDALLAALDVTNAAEDLRRARDNLERAQENFNEAQMHCEKAELNLKRFFR